MEIAIIKMLSFRFLILLGAISLVACGGGGSSGGKSSSSSSVASDTTPNAFTFTASTEAQTSTNITSPAVTISDIDAAASVSINGGEYSIGGGAFTSAAGSISNGQTLTVRITTSDKTNTPKEATVTVGGVSAKFVVTTAADVTPDAFSFESKAGVDLSTEQTSEAITVKGIDIAVPVSITGGFYSINNGEFTTAAGTVSAGQTITVKTTSDSKTDTPTAAVLVIGVVSGTFTVTTVADTFAPIAEFKFPTPYTMSEANEVKVRGIATDDNAIKEVKLVVRSFNLATPDVTISTEEVVAAPKSESDGVNDFSSWTATIPLTANAENEIKVIATDDRDNSISVSAASKVIVRQATIANAFPDEVNQFNSVSGGIVYDNHYGRDRLIVSDVAGDSLIAVDLNSGARSVFKDLYASGFSDIWGMLIESTEGAPMLRAIEYGRGNLHTIDLGTGDILRTFNTNLYRAPRSLILDEKDGTNHLVTINDDSYGEGNNGVISFSENYQIFSTLSEPSLLLDFQRPWGITLDKNHNRYLVSKGNQNPDSNMHGLYAINRSTGERTLFSSNLIGAGEKFSADTGSGRAFLRDIVVDVPNNRVIVPESITGKLFSIDLDTAERKVIANFDYVEGLEEVRPRVFNIKLNSINDTVFLTETERNSILLVDLITGEKIIISKSNQ